MSDSVESGEHCRRGDCKSMTVTDGESTRVIYPKCRCRCWPCVEATGTLGRKILDRPLCVCEIGLKCEIHPLEGSGN